MSSAPVTDSTTSTINHTSAPNRAADQLALFDLDHTLLDVDSDYSWGVYLVEQGLVDAQVYQQANQRFYQQYLQGNLDATEYNEFVARFLTTRSLTQLQALRQDYIDNHIVPHIRPKACACMRKHQQAGHAVVIISATNDFIVQGIALHFDVAPSHVLATPLQLQNQRYTGKLADRPNFQEGKLYHLQRWLDEQAKQGIHFNTTYAYSDSNNDLPLLQWADVAVCVSPDATLEAHALAKHWPIEDWSLASSV